MSEPIDVILVTGMSGAGRSTATRALEDLGWFVVDNLPPKLMGEVVEYVPARAGSTKVAVVADVRGGNLFSDVQLYDWWAGNIRNGHFPINDDMWQYPPLAALVFVVGHLIAPATVGFVFLALATLDESV